MTDPSGDTLQVSTAPVLLSSVYTNSIPEISMSNSNFD